MCHAAGDKRVPFRDRPADLDSYAREWHEWQFLDGQALHEVLTTVSAVPFGGTEEYTLRGGLKEAAGVQIFHGRIGWLKRSEKTGQGEPRWYDELRLFVTDSNPQYLCVQASLDTHDD